MDCAIYLLVTSQLNLQRSLPLALLRVYSHSDPTPYVAEMHLQLRLRLGLCIVITTGIGHKSNLQSQNEMYFAAKG